MAKKKRRLPTFSAVQAVKANARERLGTPPPSTAIPDRRSKDEHKPPKHRRSLEELMASTGDDNHG